MTKMWAYATGLALLLIIIAAFPRVVRGNSDPDSRKHEGKLVAEEFRTSDRCVSCHNGMKSTAREDYSIGKEWRASIMANASRDPYWQASVRRETMDHPEVQGDVQDECSTCHMPVVYFTNRDAHRGLTEVLQHLPLTQKTENSDRGAVDGVTCSVCHQIEDSGLGTKATFNGNVAFTPPAKDDLRPEYGPFIPDGAHQRIMQSSTTGYIPEQGDQIRNPGLCGSCHTLYTKARGPGGKVIGTLPEQMPFKEWQHSDYNSPTGETCQTCHMPQVNGQVPITALYGPLRDGAREHVFVGANFVMERMLNDHRKELDTAALPEELDAQTKLTIDFLKSRSATVSIDNVHRTASGLALDVQVVNLTGHKLPTAYPARRVWLHVLVRDASGHIVFESGALNPDGSIVGNDNDADPLKFEPYYSEITRPDQVEIYESILKDYNGKVTTGLLSAVTYLKDDRLLPPGFDKVTADKDISVIGDAAKDPNFNGKGSIVRYLVPTGSAAGPFHIHAELMYQPIGFRWAHNLSPYKASEPQRMVQYYEQASRDSAVALATAEASR